MNLNLSIGKFNLALGSNSEVATKMSPDAAAWVNGADVDANDRNMGAKLAQPYSQSAWVYVCVNLIAKNLSQIPFRIARLSNAKQKRLARTLRGTRDAREKTLLRRTIGESIVESGPIVDLFDHPHKTMDRGLFWASVCMWDCLRGEFFILPQDSTGNPVDLTSRRTGQITSIITVPPELFWHIVVGYDLTGWRYTGSPLITPIESQLLLPEELIHCRTFNPYLYWRGMSPLAVALLPAQTDFASEMFMRGLLMNNADQGVIVTTDQQPSEDQRQAILAALRERKRKAGTADRPLFLWGGSKVERPTVSSADMQFLENRKLNRQEIGSIYGVPEFMMGFSQAKSLGNGTGEEQERYNFIESTITPLARRLEAAVDPIIDSFGAGYIGYFDVDSLPVMQEARRTRVDSAVKVFGMGVPFNELNHTYDLGFKEIAWGNKGYIGGLLQEAGEGDVPGDNDPDPEDEPNEEKSNPLLGMEKFIKGLVSAPAVQCKAPHAFEAAIAPAVKLKEKRLAKFFFNQRTRVLAAMEKEIGKSITAEVRANKSLDDIWNADDENKKLLAQLKPLILADLEFGGAQVWSEIGESGDFDLAPSDAIKFLDQRTPVIKDINATTWEAIKTQLQDGLKAGESFDQLTDRVKTIFNTASESRAGVIALTETNTAINSGRQIAMVDAGVERKGWLTSHLENVRATHAANEAYSKENNGIAIDGVWPNGCAYPGDPDGEAGEVINCRCVGYAIAGEKDEVPKSFLNFRTFLARKAAREKLANPELKP